MAGRLPAICKLAKASEGDGSRQRFWPTGGVAGASTLPLPACLLTIVAAGLDSHILDVLGCKIPGQKKGFKKTVVCWAALKPHPRAPANPHLADWARWVPDTKPTQTRRVAPQGSMGGREDHKICQLPSQRSQGQRKGDLSWRPAAPQPTTHPPPTPPSTPTHTANRTSTHPHAVLIQPTSPS